MLRQLLIVVRCTYVVFTRSMHTLYYMHNIN